MTAYLSRLVALGIAAATLSGPVQAEVLPHLFADSYCNLRSVGVSHQDALQTAVRRAMTLRDAGTVTVQGKQLDASAVEAWIAVSRLCPSYFRLKPHTSI